LKVKGQQVTFTLHALAGANTGTLAGSLRATSQPGRYTYAGPGCQLTFRTEAGGAVRVTQGPGSCGAGLGVGFAGVYRRGPSAATPLAASLYRLGLVPTAALDQAIRQRTGPVAYAQVLRSAGQVERLDSLDGRPARALRRLWVPGLGGLSESLLLFEGSDFWLATVEGDSILYWAPAGGPAAMPAPLAEWVARLGKPVVAR
jgi:hypothetical protein